MIIKAKNMKKLIYLLPLLLIFGACKSTNHCQKSKADCGKTLSPYEVDNFWVYKSVELNQIDTLRVESHQKTEDGVKVDLNFEKWLIKGDSIFVRCVSSCCLPKCCKCETNYNCHVLHKKHLICHN